MGHLNTNQTFRNSRYWTGIPFLQRDLTSFVAVDGKLSSKIMNLVCFMFCCKYFNKCRSYAGCYPHTSNSNVTIDKQSTVTADTVTLMALVVENVTVKY